MSGYFLRAVNREVAVVGFRNGRQNSDAVRNVRVGNDGAAERSVQAERVACRDFVRFDVYGDFGCGRKFRVQGERVIFHGFRVAFNFKFFLGNEVRFRIFKKNGVFAIGKIAKQNLIVAVVIGDGRVEYAVCVGGIIACDNIDGRVGDGVACVRDDCSSKRFAGFRRADDARVIGAAAGCKDQGSASEHGIFFPKCHGLASASRFENR